MESQTLTFTFERATKNTIRYEEQKGTPPMVGILYLQKWAVGAPPPQSITVTIEAVNSD